MIVADSNLIASCVLESSTTEAARRLRSSDNEWYVPKLWRYEVTNILATMIRVRGLPPKTAISIFDALSESLKPYERDPVADDAFSLVADYGITDYDAQFVALAQELRCMLYTQDKEILDKFPTLAKPFYRKR